MEPLEILKGKGNAPYAIRTPLGWVLSGTLPGGNTAPVTCYAATSEDGSLAEQVRGWWALEAYGTAVNVDPRSKEDQIANKLLKDHTKFKDVRYEVPMLLKNHEIDIPNNYYVAIKRLHSLEAKLAKNEELRQNYQKTIDVDLEKGYIEKVDEQELRDTENKPQWYLPHHPVVNVNKPAKVRRVVDAAALSEEFHSTQN
jgi:hypothetical protein